MRRRFKHRLRFNVSRLDIRGDWNLVEGSVDATASATIGGGNDRISVRNVQLLGHATFDTRLVFIRTGLGNDRVEVLDSVFRFLAADLGDGNDSLEFSNNVFGEASLNGGLGFDSLTAHNNLGLLIFFAFEHTDVSS
jgi:hypothetical protein